MEGLSELYDCEKSYSYDKMEKIRQKIENMDTNSHMYILKLMRENNVEYSENKNGCFINMMNLNTRIFEKIEKYIEFIEAKDNNLNQLTERQEKIKKTMVKHI